MSRESPCSVACSWPLLCYFQPAHPQPLPQRPLLLRLLPLLPLRFLRQWTRWLRCFCPRKRKVPLFPTGLPDDSDELWWTFQGLHGQI